MAAIAWPDGNLGNQLAFPFIGINDTLFEKNNSPK